MVKGRRPATNKSAGIWGIVLPQSAQRKRFAVRIIRY